jgi:pectinesterase
MRNSLFAIIPALASVLAAAPSASVTVRNPIDVARPSETIVLDAAELRALLSVEDVRKIHVRAEGSDKDLLIQAVDTNDDGVFEQFLFQADFAPAQTRVFVLTPGDRQIAKVEDYKTYGRFVRERRDDFAWENDRIAHRMYGKELETWPREPLVSSSVDVWTKRVRQLVINNWYMVDDYHREHGQGGDFYSAGATRGDGGTGIWTGGKLYPSANFRDTRVYAVGPIRLMFELTYETWTTGGARVSEKKRVSLDAGHNLDRFESRYTIDGNAADLMHAVGIRKLKITQMKPSPERGIMRTWEPVREGGEMGQAVLVDPASLKSMTEDDLNFLMLTKIEPGVACVSYSGFGWTPLGDFQKVEDWDRYLADEAARLKTPVEIKIAKQ